MNLPSWEKRDPHGAQPDPKGTLLTSTSHTVSIRAEPGNAASGTPGHLALSSQAVQAQAPRTSSQGLPPPHPTPPSCLRPKVPNPAPSPSSGTSVWPHRGETPRAPVLFGV